MLNEIKHQIGELVRVGGKNIKDMVHKIMKKVFKDSILMDYTYYGLRNKNNFSNLLINKAIIGNFIIYKYILF